MKEKEVKMWDIELDLDKKTYDRLISFARDNILNDEQALINWGVNHALKEIIEKEKNDKSNS